MTHVLASIPSDPMSYRRCGKSGLMLSAISLGLWNNFGAEDSSENARAMIRRALDLGITHIDLANNYGPPPGSAEETFGRLMADELSSHRDQIVISTKAGYYMWPGPYGNWGSRKSLLASLDQSLRRMRLEYVDIFYHHRPDPETPLEETMGALDSAVRAGKALYVGISSYSSVQTREAAGILAALGTRCLVHQPRYNALDRRIEHGLLGVLGDDGIGCVAFSPLAEGLLTDRYLHGIAPDSRAARSRGNLTAEHLSTGLLTTIAQLNDHARMRGQTLAQMAIAWVLRHEQMTSAVIGASKVQHIDEAVGALANTTFTNDELALIDAILAPVTEAPSTPHGNRHSDSAAGSATV